MNGLRILAVLLIAAGVLGLAYRGFTYTKETHEAKVGPIEVAVKERETVEIPVWASAAAIVAGTAMLLVERKKT
jgi:hypothetical protein